jgi:hypothetical protein
MRVLSVQRRRLEGEGLKVVVRGKRYFVDNYENHQANLKHLLTAIYAASHSAT